MKETLDDLKTRRSCRKFEERQISDDELNAVLEAGTFAPSGMNRQPCTMVVVQDKATRDQLSKINGEIMGNPNDPFYGAPTVIVVLVDPEAFTGVEDASLMMGNLLNAAQAVGLGSCWIHRAKETFERPEGKALLKKWGLPENLRGVGNCILGYAVEGGTREPTPRKTQIVRV